LVKNRNKGQTGGSARGRCSRLGGSPKSVRGNRFSDA